MYETDQKNDAYGTQVIIDKLLDFNFNFRCLKNIFLNIFRYEPFHIMSTPLFSA